MTVPAAGCPAVACPVDSHADRRKTQQAIMLDPITPSRAVLR
jgi:hypothetical protein